MDRARSKEAGCDGHLVKPVNLPDLEKLLTKLQGDSAPLATHQYTKDSEQR